jgi:hypothetical protein
MVAATLYTSASGVLGNNYLPPAAAEFAAKVVDRAARDSIPMRTRSCYDCSAITNIVAN